jgi:hypothetical protein
MKPFGDKPNGFLLGGLVFRLPVTRNKRSLKLANALFKEYLHVL